MTDDRHHPTAREFWRAHWPVLLVFFIVPSVIELVLTAADHGLIASTRLRMTAYQNGAFWAGLLDNWRPNYPGQQATMFFSYSFLHAGLWHLGGNMLALLMLIQLTDANLNGWRFLVVYMASGFGGALGFALLGTVLNPMVGASGALFGVAGAWRWTEWRAIPGQRDRGIVIVRDLTVLIVLNALMWYLQDRALAWEAHLGGFAAGVAAMAILPRRD